MRSLLRPAASLLSARASRSRRRLGNGHAAQAATLSSLVSSYAKTAYGRAHGLPPDANHAEFSLRMPTRAYEGFTPWITRMLHGERDILWPGDCTYFAVSSGTTAGRTKYLPVTPAMLNHFRGTGIESLMCASARLGSASLFEGRHLFLGGATRLEPLSRPSGCAQAWTGDLSGITALNLPAWAESFLYEPGRDIAQMTDWPSKLDAIARRTLDRDIRLIAGIPSWILVLAETLRHRSTSMGRSVRNLADIWPGLRCLVHGGVPITPYVEELREALGERVLFHEVYPASEAFIAVQDDEPEAGLRLLADAGIYYEFAPLAFYNEQNPEGLSRHAVPLEGVCTGVDYVLLLSTPAGLCRYIIGDVVRFTSTDIPRLVYSGRTRLQLSAFGEHVIERELTDSLAAACNSFNLRVSNFHVAPIFVDQQAGIHRGRHEWLLSTRQVLSVSEQERLSALFDAELSRRNDDYEAKRRGGGLDLPKVSLIHPEAFEAWQKLHGKYGGQNKFPRCRSDREVADALLAWRP